MRFTETKLAGAHVVDVEARRDDRGYFARVWCEREFREAGLDPSIVQTNVGFSARRGTLRGMHLQLAPYAEVKLVRCTRGIVFDVIVDLRPDSPTHCQWVGYELSAENSRMLYVPHGFAHGYQTLTDDAEICYQTSHAYAPSAATGVRYDDPVFGIAWPTEITSISEADQAWPDYKPAG